VRQVRQAIDRNSAAIEKLSTREQAEAYLENVRKKVRECFGPEPQRTELKPRITGTVERETYKIEKVIFDSRPGFPVTANLYLPKDREMPRPGVVGTCGHSSNGKAAEPYQAFAQGLVKLGYVCLIYDPIGQGERLQYTKDDLKSWIGVGVREHLHAGNQQFLVGEFLGMWRAWDGIRALDYLLTRPEVDPQQVGVTGNSGGGTMTTWLCGVESRWSMAGPSCFVTSFLRNAENELPADTEQCPPQALALSLDHADFLAAMAPKPVIVLGKERDFFDVRGTEEAFAKLQHIYRLLDAEKNIGLFVGPTDHGYSQENREAMYRWFNQATQAPPVTEEPALTIEQDETLWCTEKGQVATLENTKTVFDFTREKSHQLAASRKKLTGQELGNAVRRVLRIPRQGLPLPEYRVLRDRSVRGYPTPYAASYAVQSEPGIHALVTMLTDQRWYSRPPRAGQRAVLYVAHRSSDRELQVEPVIRELIEAEPKSPFFAVDVRGIGESKPNTCGTNSFDSVYGCDFFYAIHGLMLDRPYLGRKTFDVLRTIDWLAANGYDDIHLCGNGWGALAATFAAVLSDNVTQVTLKHALKSYAEVAETEDYQWPLSTLLPDVLMHFDLPDCYQELADKKLRQIEPWGAADGRAVI
jgi:dienelactone hydrolase